MSGLYELLKDENCAELYDSAMLSKWHEQQRENRIRAWERQYEKEHGKPRGVKMDW